MSERNLLVYLLELGPELQPRLKLCSGLRLGLVTMLGLTQRLPRRQKGLS